MCLPQAQGDARSDMDVYPACKRRQGLQGSDLVGGGIYKT